MANDLSPAQWASAVLERLGAHPTPGGVQALVGWAKAEGGHWNNDARFNPLNTTQPEPGAGNTGAQGNIKVYKDWNQGIDATVKTLKNGRYGAIVSALHKGDAGAVAHAIGQTPWGTAGSLVQQTIAAAAGTPVGHSKEVTPSAPTTPTPVAPTAAPDARRAALQAYVLAQGTQDQPDSLLNLARGLSPAQATPVAAPAPDVKTSLRQRRVTPASSSGGTVDFDGKKVAGWIGDALTYARSHGWKGTVNSGFRTDEEQTRIYKSGVRPAAVPKSMGGGGSNHEGTVFPLGAVDVSEAPQLADILKNSPYGKKLQWAGSKDPVHFSHPHNGSY